MNEVNAQMADRAAGASDPYRRAGRSCTGSTGFHITVFEPSYQEPCSSVGARWPWAAGEKIRIFKVNMPIDPTADGPVIAAYLQLRITCNKAVE